MVVLLLVQGDVIIGIMVMLLLVSWCCYWCHGGIIDIVVV